MFEALIKESAKKKLKTERSLCALTGGLDQLLSGPLGLVRLLILEQRKMDCGWVMGTEIFIDMAIC